jgi:hypothetical protein
MSNNKGRPKGRSPKPEVLAREAEVVKLRRGGLTWDLIAQKTGYADPSGAQTAYMRAAQRLVQDDIAAIRSMEMERLDIAQSAIWGQVLNGSLSAVTTLMRIMERRARLLGLDQPIKQQVEVTNYDGATIDREVQRLADLLGAGDRGQARILDTPESQT